MKSPGTAVVGLTERPEITLALLEARVPSLMANVTKQTRPPSHATTLFNPWTKTNSSGAVSSHARNIIRTKAKQHYDDEYYFYPRRRSACFGRV